MKTVLVLGAYSDIARATATKFASENFNLILAGRSKTKLIQLQQDIIIKFKVSVKVFQFDAADCSSHAAFYDNLGDRPDITICVVGYLGEQAVAQNSWDEACKILTANYIGLVSILNIIANEYEETKSGAIIGVSSVAGERGRQSNFIYGSSKGGFSIYLDGLRNRLYKSNVHVLSIKPGFVATKMTEGLDLPKALTATSEQVADAIYKGYIKKKDIVYTLPIWKYIMLIIKIIPERFFKKLKL
jgi:decaprenylphospho-beta-D-erythro-pentofuranosid-2-ulose 2-reductase